MNSVSIFVFIKFTYICIILYSDQYREMIYIEIRNSGEDDRLIINIRYYHEYINGIYIYI